jgi:hypothetical protein
MARQRLAPGPFAPIYVNETGRAQRLAGATFVNDTASTVLTLDGVAASDWTGARDVDVSSPIAFDLALLSDQTTGSVWNGSLALEASALPDLAGLLAVSGRTPVDASTTSLADAPALVEAAALGVLDNRAPIATGARASMEALSPPEAGATASLVIATLTDWTGALIITADVVAPVAVLAQLAADVGGPVAQLAALHADSASWRDAARDVHVDAGLLADLGSIDAARLKAALDRVASTVAADGAPVAWSADIVGAAQEPIASGADLAALTAAAVEWFARQPIRRVLLIFRTPR